jgi:hypothetical protein
MPRLRREHGERQEPSKPMVHAVNVSHSERERKLATPPKSQVRYAREPMLRYIRELNGPRTVLWCYWIWYVGVVIRYFDATPSLWLSSIGISAIIGTGLFLSTTRSGVVPVRIGGWQVFRLYLMPFCVSSFAGLIKGRGFILVFHPTLQENLIMFVACAAFVAVVQLLKRASRVSDKQEAPEERTRRRTDH